MGEDVISGLFDPGTGISDSGIPDSQLPDEIPNLDPSYSGTLLGVPATAILPASLGSVPNDPTGMDDLNFLYGSNDPLASGAASTSDPLAGAASSFFGSLGTIGTGLANAFLINPQNAQTQAQQSTLAAELQIAESSNLFTYVIIGLVIYLLFSAFEK